MKRRDFILSSAAGMAGLSAPDLIAGLSIAPPLSSIGLQLYTLRELAKRDLERTLADVAGAGYSEVEFAGYFGHQARSVRRMLDDNGLTSPSTHLSMEDLTERIERSLDDAVTLGQRYVVCSWIDAKDRTPDGYRRIAQRFNQIAVKAHARKLQLGYHNHSYEFTPLADGRCGLEILIAECPVANLVLEADVHWMRVAGEDPLSWFARHPGRIHMLHVKDTGPHPQNAMADVGAGTTDWVAVLQRAIAAGAKHFFVEHDEPADPIASVVASRRYLSRLQL